MSRRQPSDVTFQIGEVRLEPRHGDMRDIEADAVVQSASVYNDHRGIPWVAHWARATDPEGSIERALAKHQPFEPGQVYLG